MNDPESIKKFGAAIQRLIQRNDLTREECHELFREILLGHQPDLQQGAFLAALVAKGETAEEIAGAWQAIDEIDTVHTRDEWPDSDPVVENSGTGMDRLKTFNASSAAAIIAAACGVRIGRHGARALTSSCGAIDILEAMGIDVECGVDVVEKSILEAGIGIFNGMSPLVHPQALGRILSQIRFGSTLNIAASLANPCRPTRGVRGVYSDTLVPKVVSAMREIGYRRAIVVHGFAPDGGPGMDEISPIGPTLVTELDESGQTSSYTLVPEDFGLSRVSYEDIRPTGNLGDESVRFIQVVAGRGSQACRDFVCLNAAAILRVAGIESDWTNAFELARQALESRAGLDKLRLWAHCQNASGKGPGIFEELASRAGCS